MFPRLYLWSLFYCASILTPSLILINLTQPEPRNNLFKFDSHPSESHLFNYDLSKLINE